MANYSNISYVILISASTPSIKPPYVSAAKCGLNFTHSTLFYIKTWKCGAPYIYFNLTTDLCQDACGDYFYENVTMSSCDTCYYACMDCSMGNTATACTQCEAGLNRILVNNTCLCNDGYFDDWYSPTCRACSAIDMNCQTCTYTKDLLRTSSDYQTIFSLASWPIDIKPDYKCTLCKPAFFVNSSFLCESCPLSYCTLCANLTACQTCDSSVNATKYTDNLCYLCNVGNCVMCSSNDVCDQCLPGFILSSGACLTCAQACNCGGWVLPMVNGSCSTLCGDGYKLGSEECDDNNTNNHDGCSSTCTNETCSVSCACDGWIQPWVNGSCSTVCGDSYQRGSEQCDDGNTNGHDGCSSTCSN
jgi:cysteine-rich repeat protein